MTCRDPNASPAVLPLPLAVQLDLQNELDRLVCRLRAARDQFVPDESAARPAVLEALRSTIQFLSRFSIIDSEGLLAPLGNLLTAIEHLDSGIIDPVLRSERKGGRTPSSKVRQELKGFVVYWIELASADKSNNSQGARLAAAYTTAATVLNAHGVRPERGDGKFTARTIRGWREDVAADVGFATAAGQSFKRLRDIKFIAPPEAMPDGERADALRQILAKLLEALGFRKPPKPQS